MSKACFYTNSLSEVRPFSGVIFDMDGIIFDTEVVQLDAWKKASNEMGYNDNTFFKTLIGTNKKTADDLIINRFGKDVMIDDLRKRKDEIVNDWHAKNGMPFKKGAIELINFLTEREIPMGIATSSSKNRLEYCLKMAGLHDRFDAVVTGDQIESGKPNPEIFLKAAAKLSINPMKLLAFEDSDLGIKAADEAKMIVIHIPDLIETTPAMEEGSFDVLPSISESLSRITIGE